MSRLTAVSPFLLSLFALSLSACLAPSVCAAAAQGNKNVASPLLLQATIPLPNVKGRIDHLSVDVAGQRLFIAAVENHSVEVIDLKSRQAVHSIPNLPEPQGVFYEPTTNRLFVACGLDGTTRIFDGKTYEPIAAAKFADDADNIRYDSHRQTVIVGYAGAKHLRKRLEGTGGLGFLDTNGKHLGDIVIDAHPESFQLDSSASRLYVNVPEKKEIEVIDLEKRTVLARWPVAACSDNFPMALDASHHRLLVGCWQPSFLLAFDIETGKQTGAVEIAGKTDDIFYDAQRSRIYVLTSVGFLEVFSQTDADRYARIARYPTPPGTQTGFFVSEWSQLFAAVRAQDGKSAEIRIYEAQ